MTSHGESWCHDFCSAGLIINQRSMFNDTDYVLESYNLVIFSCDKMQQEFEQLKREKPSTDRIRSKQWQQQQQQEEQQTPPGGQTGQPFLSESMGALKEDF